MLYALGEISPEVQGKYYVAPDAAVIGDVYLAEDTSIWFGAVLRGDVERITIGRGSNVQDGSVLHCDPGAPLTLDECVTIGHQVMLHGCRIGQNSLIGIGSTILITPGSVRTRLSAQILWLRKTNRFRTAC
jgi:carbonic anhydrase/acetyltransferase-like protein (isoleucine patch superfamily)